MSAAKPVDLVASRDLARRLEHFDMPGTAKMMGAMTDEIEALREALGTMLRLHDREEHDHNGATVEAIRVRLPPS